MNKKTLIITLIISIISLGVIMTLVIRNALKSDGHHPDEVPATGSTAENQVQNDPTDDPGEIDYSAFKYVSSVGGVQLSTNDPDYVGIRADAFDINTIVATDALGRKLPTDGTGDNGRQAAIFYLLWHDGKGGTDIFQDSLDSGKQLLYAKYYWWGKPLLGFYRSDDTWVMRRHIEMLIYAGIDYLVLDATNGHAYHENALKLMELLHEYNEAGWNAPKVVFYTNTDSLNTVMEAFKNIYEPRKYQDTWYMVDGKPLIIGNALSSFFNDYFTVRQSQWPNHTGEKTPGGFPWIDFADVATVQYDVNGKHGVIPVSTAQNCSPRAWFSDNVLYGMTGDNGGSRGRSWHNGADNITEDSYKYGYNFQEEWDTAIASDAETAMILEWNEWRAGVWSSDGKIAIFDAFTNEFSRDIEPMEGGFFDNYYLQMAANIRRFKNTGSSVSTTRNTTIDVKGAFGQWQSVADTYIDMPGITAPRDNLSYGNKGKERLTDSTGRNSLLCAKVAKDASNLYFYIQTADDISEDREGTWMNLYLDTDGDLLDNWNGYEFRVNGLAEGAASTGGTLCLEKYSGSSFEKVAEIAFRAYGNQLMLAIPKAYLGINSGSFTVDFKWADSRAELESVEDFYRYGDVMPYGRFNYAFNAG